MRSRCTWMRSRSVRRRSSHMRSRATRMRAWCSCMGSTSRGRLRLGMQSSRWLRIDDWDWCCPSRMAYWKRSREWMIVWMVWPRHGVGTVARMCGTLPEMTIDHTVSSRSIAFKFLSRVTKKGQLLHFRRACRSAFDFGSVLGYRSNGVDVDGSLRSTATLIEVMSV